MSAVLCPTCGHGADENGNAVREGQRNACWPPCEPFVSFLVAAMHDPAMAEGACALLEIMPKESRPS